MRILLVALEWPFPPQNGGAIATASFAGALVASHELTIYTLDSHATNQTEVILNSTIRRFGHPCRRPRNLWSYLGSWIKAIPLAPFRNWHPVPQAWLDQHAQEFDLLIFDHLIPAVYLKAGMPPAILIEQNAEYSLWMRAAESHKHWYLRPLLRLEALRMRSFEQKVCNAVKAVVTLTPEDRALLAPLAPATPFEVIPPCLPKDPLVGLTSLQPPPGKRILFVGTLSWEPNSDGLLWFAKDIWPLVLTHHPDAVLEVVGRGLSVAAQKTLAQVQGIHLLGFQECLAPFYSGARIVIAPLRFGSGFKLKVLEGMAYGVPVVTTTVGAEGFAINGVLPVTLCETNQQWQDSIDLLFVDDNVWAECSQIQRVAFITRFSAESRTLLFNNLTNYILHTNY